MRTVTKLALVAAGAATAGTLAARQWSRTWGLEPELNTRPLPGDDIVPEPTAVETRVLEIDAPPAAVWPWLVQMGYGRAGWYSYDVLDMDRASVEEIVEAWQNLAIGDIVPTHPDGGFEVAAIDEGRALVLKTDTELVERQVEAAKAAKAKTEETPAPPAEVLAPMPPGLQASAAMLSATPKEFAVSWAFVLDPAPGHRTRLIERFRVHYPTPGRGFTLISRPFGFGVFVMMQRQMVGIARRAEALAGEQATAIDGEAPVEPSPLSDAPPIEPKGRKRTPELVEVG